MGWLRELILFRLLILMIQLKKIDYNTKINETERKTTDNNLGKHNTQYLLS